MNDPVVTDPGGQDAQVVRRRLDAEGGVWRYSIRVGGKVVQVLEPGIAPPPESGDPHDWIQEPSEPARRIAATLTRAKLREQLTDTVYSFRATRTIFRPYQFRPVMKLLRTGRHRLLIADEVGLGKTIEAGLIWTEFDARGQADRVLVVCPSMLVPKWIRE
ncbi:MAG: SNF2-related protein, partial [Lentisphaeria bacterium]|nr:SNF2-related protein [Lentisphaeria bacterium]